jgi:hypothetical protein
MIAFSIFIYTERIVFNNIVMRIQTLIIDENLMNKLEWLGVLIDVNVVLYTVTDFIGGCI